jgi:hypothetical protein
VDLVEEEVDRRQGEALRRKRLVGGGEADRHLRRDIGGQLRAEQHLDRTIDIPEHALATPLLRVTVRVRHRGCQARAARRRPRIARASSMRERDHFK